MRGHSVSGTDFRRHSRKWEARALARRKQLLDLEKKLEAAVKQADALADALDNIRISITEHKETP